MLCETPHRLLLQAVTVWDWSQLCSTNSMTHLKLMPELLVRFWSHAGPCRSAGWCFAAAYRFGCLRRIKKKKNKHTKKKKQRKQKTQGATSSCLYAAFVGRLCGCDNTAVFVICYVWQAKKEIICAKNTVLRALHMTSCIPVLKVHGGAWILSCPFKGPVCISAHMFLAAHRWARRRTMQPRKIR